MTNRIGIEKKHSETKAENAITSVLTFQEAKINIIKLFFNFATLVHKGLIQH